MVRVLGQAGRGGPGREPVGESRDGLPGERETVARGLGLPQSARRLGELRAEAVGQGPDGVLLDVERVAQEPAVPALTAGGARQGECPHR